jgi:hypothetical protein
MKLKIKWSSPVPFKWDEETDLVEVDENEKIEALADMVEDIFDDKTREFRGEQQYDFQV